MSNYCFCSLLTSDDYVLGCLGINYSLKQVNSIYPYEVIVTDNVSQSTLDLLSKHNIKYRVYPLLNFKDGTDKFNALASRFYIFDLPYEKVICLDADYIVFRNFDYCFDFKFPLVVKRKMENDQVMFGGGLICIEPNDLRKKFILGGLKNILQDVYTDEHILHYVIPEAEEFPNDFKLCHPAFPKKYWFYCQTEENVFDFLDWTIKNHNGDFKRLEERLKTYEKI